MNSKCALVVSLSEKKLAIGNEDLMHERFPKHLRMGTARMKQDTEMMKKVRREV